MNLSLSSYGPAFKRALTVSGILHLALFGLIAANPQLPKKPAAKGVIHYINLGGGGGGLSGPAGGGGQPVVTTTPLPKASLRDLTTVQKLEAQKAPDSELRYPVEKPKRTPKKTPDKKAVVSKPDPKAKAAEAGSTAAGTQGAAEGTGGTGLSFGPPGAEGEGFGFGGDPGLLNFPFTWYVEDIRKKIYESWIVSVIQIGTEKPLQTWVYFRIFRDGSTSRVEVKGSSGVQAFDMIAQRAITNARFAPLPKEYDEDYLGINLVFEHRR
ncbi:MAG: hypothetical protein FJY80_05135 [Candidatus Aminicenantes bacterium]|nr:hypothetical protein [Candidatus Aminicenantes bacterium]